MPFHYAFAGRHLPGARCSSCGFVSLHPMLSDEEIAGLYREEYFTTCSDTCGAHGRAAYMEDARHSSARHRRKAAELDRLLTRRLGQRGRLLEIGCGPGFLLAELEKLGWQVAGVEISEYAAHHARETFGLDVAVGPVEQGARERDSCDAAYMGDVLEHLPRPREALRTVGTWIAPGGVLVVDVPSTLNAPSARLGLWLYARRGSFKTLRIPPYHVCEYAPHTLRAMLQAAGFEVYAVRQEAVPLRRMALRGSFLENVGKAALQVAAHLTVRLANRGGDRLRAVAVRPLS